MRYCLTLDLRDDPLVLAEYDRYHRDVWPEVLADMRTSGVDDMTIWRLGNRLVMWLVLRPGVALDALRPSPSAHPRVIEWQAQMRCLQKPLPGSTVAEWKPMEVVFQL